MYTLSEFRSSRVHTNDLESILPDWGLEGVSGYVYLGQYYIETTVDNLTRTPNCRTVLARFLRSL